MKVDFALEPGLLARADAGPLSQIVINLLLNAAQAMGGQGQVRVSTRREGGEVRLEVEDTGPGIPSEVMPRLFEPFFTTKEGKGTGLGLAVSLHLAQSMGGRLTAENVPGRRRPLHRAPARRREPGTTLPSGRWGMMCP